MAELLKPCAHCGSDLLESHRVYYNTDSKSGEHTVICCPCGESVAGKTWEDANAAWNRRADGWASVEERLPEDKQVVLVKGTNTNHLFKGYDVGWRIDGRWTCWFTTNITHWRPLPELPK